MQIIKFIKHGYKYYKSNSDTSADIDQIFGFVQALDKKRNIKLVNKFNNSEIAKKVYTDISDIDKLKKRRFKKDTFGSDFKKFIGSMKHDLFKESIKTIKVRSKKEERFYQRAMYQHDLIHFLNDYDTSPVGEVMVLSFNLAKEWRWSYFAILFSSFFMALRNSFDSKKTFNGSLYQKIKFSPLISFCKLVKEGYQHGKQSDWLMTVDYDELYNLPTSEVKKLLNITPSKYWLFILPFWKVMHEQYKKVSTGYN